MQDQQKVITVRKYKNRKLYDQKKHCYITLADVLDMYRKGISFSVIDPEDQDITEKIIVQSVLEHSIENEKFREILLDFAKNHPVSGV